MLVYGDHSERVDPQGRLRAVAEELARTSATSGGLERHSALIGSFIEAGRLLQGVADADFAAVGHDRQTSATDALTRFLRELAECVCVSWDSSFDASWPVPSVPRIDDLPPEVELKLPEGYAFYALYPEAYVDAGRSLELTGPPCVIGIRSIGTSLAAAVAAAVGAPNFYTVRPYGEPFERSVDIGPELADELLSGSPHYVIVDEGPGLSGSSFGGIADWLEARNVPLERIAFIPNHPNPPGAQASEAHRRGWDRVQKRVADLGPRLPTLLGQWTAGLLGRLDEPLVDLSAGEWRGLVYSDARHWPPVNTGWERRKYLARAGGRSWLIKFAGLGAIGERKHERARMLHFAGLVPEPRGLVHGFLVERWHGEAAHLGSDEKPIAEVARYIGTRARLLPAERAGASLTELLTMAKRNATLALGDTLAATFEGWQARLPDLERRVVPVETDNRPDRHEWLRLPDGRLLKADALDHHAAHDLIGCQAMAWDVAGAICEFRLSAAEAKLLVAATERASDREVDPELLRFYRMTYLGFRLGQATMGADASDPGGSDALGLRASAAGYAAELQHLLVSRTRATRQESWVG